METIRKRGDKWQARIQGVAKALRILGYRPVREYTKAGAGCRFWLAPEAI